MTPLERTRLEKAASDCGFELSPELGEHGLIFRSAKFPEFISVQALGGDQFLMRSSASMLLSAVGVAGELLSVQGWNVLYEMLDKASATARTMPDRVAQRFNQATAMLPRSTEAERWVVQRVGQDLFRSALLDFWRGRCCITGLAVPELLRASHIRPWALCNSDEQRLDVFNGLLLSPTLDALFDGGWITFNSEGTMAIAASLPSAEFELLGLGGNLHLQGLKAEHCPYLEFHRERVFRDTAASA